MFDMIKSPVCRRNPGKEKSVLLHEDATIVELFRQTTMVKQKKR